MSCINLLIASRDQNKVKNQGAAMQQYGKLQKTIFDHVQAIAADTFHTSAWINIQDINRVQVPSQSDVSVATNNNN